MIEVRTHSEVAENTILTIDFDHAFPVDWFFDVHVAGVQKSGFDFDDFSNLAGLDKRSDFLDGWVEWHLRTAADKNVRMFCDALKDGVVGWFVDAKRFFAHEMLTGFDDGAVDFLM